jgi:hypothetical protein
MATKIRPYGDDVAEKVWLRSVRIWGLGGKDAHRGGLAMARDSVAGKTSMTVQTNGHQSWTPGRGGPVDYGGACNTLGWAGGGWSMSVDDELTGEEVVAEGTRAPSTVADSSSSNQVLDDEDDTTVLLINVGSNECPCSGR